MLPKSKICFQNYNKIVSALLDLHFKVRELTVITKIKH